MNGTAQLGTVAVFGAVWAVLSAGHALADHVPGRTDHRAAPVPARGLGGDGWLDPGGSAGPDSPGPVGRFAAVEADMGVVGEDVNALTRSINDLAEVMERFGPQVRQAWSPGAPGAVGLAVTGRMAAALAAPAGELRERADRFAVHVERIDRAVGSVLDLLRTASTPGQVRGEVPGADAFLGELVGLAGAIREGLAGLEQFRALLAALAGMSAPLRHPAQEIARAIDRIGEVVVRAEGWERRGAATVRERDARTA
ncbi:hypothetical protein [Kitasatospora sp. NPDC088783]|uniref:hypothetical protein n=1 Tax=Kitasatospora sp. NPDC088783 TaxID=3364077 RepID=UPI00380B71E8